MCSWQRGRERPSEDDSVMEGEAGESYAAYLGQRSSWPTEWQDTESSQHSHSAAAR